MSMTTALETAAPRGTVALLFTDIQGSTQLWEKLGNEFRPLLDKHNHIMRDAISKFQGYEVKTEGDAFMVAFPTPQLALRCCLQVQHTLQHESWPDLLNHPDLYTVCGRSKDGYFAGLRVRMGIHYGEVREEPNPLTGRIDYFGKVVNRAARICDAGHGGQIVLSNSVYNALNEELSDVVLTDLGEHALKGIESRAHLWQALPRELAGRAFPRLRTPDLSRTNLPARLSSFVGRRSELKQLSELIAQQARLVTVTGAGGTGKTRLVQRFGAMHLQDFYGGVWFCDLTEARDAEDIHRAVAGTLGVTLNQQDTGQQLSDAIRSAGQILLLLDNCEHVIDEACATVEQWLQSADQAFVMCTSRQPLRVNGEHLFYLDPMPVEEAVQLFVERAQAVHPHFSTNEQNRPIIVEIVERLDRMSLAIELAAARIRMLPPDRLLERLSKRFDLLKHQRRDVAARQATLRGAIDWSWQLLEPWEQSALAQCSIFHGGFTLEAAEAVLNLEPFAEAPWVIDIIEALHDKSLLRTIEPLPGHQRFFMYESVREFAAEKLSDASVSEEDPLSFHRAAHRHATHYARFGSQTFQRSLFSHGGVERNKSIALELNNLIAALDRALSTDDAKSVNGAFTAAASVLQLRGPHLTLVKIAGRALSCTTLPERARANALVCQGRAWRLLGELERASQILGWGLQMAQQAAAEEVEATAQENLGIVADLEGKPDQSRAYYLQALPIYQKLGMRKQEGSVLNNLGILDRTKGDLDAAEGRYRQALAIQTEIGNRRSEALVLANLATVYRERKNPDEAIAYYEQALKIFRELENRRDEAIALGNLGDLHLRAGHQDQAIQCLEASVRLCQENHIRLGCYYLGSLALVYTQTGDVDKAEDCMMDAERLSSEKDRSARRGVLHCRRGHVALARNDRETAESSRALALEIAEEVRAGPESELRRAIDELSTAINAL